MISLSDQQVPDQRLVGAKAASLSRMRSLGCRISPGFILESSYCDSLLAHAGLQERLQWLQDQGSLLKETYVLQLGEEITRQLRKTPLPSELEQDINRCFEILGGEGRALICRSSSLLEDSGDGAFPGIFLSEAGLTSLAGLRQAVKNCVCSLFEPKALRYWLRWQGSQAKFSMGLIIQRVVNCTCSGIMFYWNPDNIIVEGVRGDGTSIMSGQTPPVRYRKERGGIWEMTDGAEKKSDLLRPEQLEELARIGKTASEEWKSPVDIEFGFQRSSELPFVFQCRPITRTLPGGEKSWSGTSSGINRFHGVSCSPGTTQGMAVDVAFVGHVREFSSKPIILLESLTEQQYDFLFDVKGIVTEQVGSQLNHLSIACRELGIPYVTGIDRARIRFHGRQVRLDGRKGTVSLVTQGFPGFEKHATVCPDEFPKESVSYLPCLHEWWGGAQERGGAHFKGGLYLVLEALYHARTEQELLERMMGQLSEVLKDAQSPGFLALDVPRLTPEEYSIVNHSLTGNIFSPEVLERIFQKICEEGNRRFGVTLRYQPRSGPQGNS